MAKVQGFKLFWAATSLLVQAVWLDFVLTHELNAILLSLSLLKISSKPHFRGQVAQGISICDIGVCTRLPQD
ncbi:hypothetical protein J3R82DRAFT_2717 [Butyriboletus roseoflavus]|nr:hypothetical protein J3R82DRAFT_2717 [Butyriboletus roseoflavus]